MGETDDGCTIEEAGLLPFTTHVYQFLSVYHVTRTFKQHCESRTEEFIIWVPLVLLWVRPYSLQRTIQLHMVGPRQEIGGSCFGSGGGFALDCLSVEKLLICASLHPSIRGQSLCRHIRCHHRSVAQHWDTMEGRCSSHTCLWDHSLQVFGKRAKLFSLAEKDWVWWDAQKAELHMSSKKK